MPLPGYSLYASTKAALHSFAKGYRNELNRKQLLQLVYPIATRTAFFNQEGEDAPVPWPSQKPEDVARKIIAGIKRDRRSIFPSKLFLSLNILNSYIPLIHKLIIQIEKRNFKKWLQLSG